MGKVKVRKKVRDNEGRGGDMTQLQDEEEETSIRPNPG